MFDFSTILERTEKRVEVDLLGAGPKTVDELRSIAGRLRIKYQNALERRIQRAQQQMEHDQKQQQQGGGTPKGPPPQIKDVMDKAGNMAGGLFARMKNPGFPSFANRKTDAKPAAEPEPAATIVDLPPPSETTAPAAATTPKPASAPSSMEGDWAGTDIAPATDAISNFSIGDDDDDDIL